MHSAYTGRQTTLYDMVAYRFFMYNTMGWIPAESIDSSTTGYSHSPPAPRFAVIPMIRRTAL